MSHRGYFDKFSPLPSLDEFCQLRHVVRQDVGGPQPGEVVVGVDRGQAGHLAAPLFAELKEIKFYFYVEKKIQIN